MVKIDKKIDGIDELVKKSQRDREKKYAVDLMAGLVHSDIYKNKSKRKESGHPVDDLVKTALPPKRSPDFEAMRSRVSDPDSEEEAEKKAPSVQKQDQDVPSTGMPFYGQESEPAEAKEKPTSEEEPEDSPEKTESEEQATDPSTPVVPPQTGSQQANDGWVNMVSGGLAQRMQQMGKESLNDPAIKRQLHALGWEVIETFITPAIIITFPAANYFAIVGKLWKKDDFKNPLYHIFSTAQIWLLILLDILCLMALLFLFVIIVITYCYASFNFLVAALPGDSGICEGLGIINMLQLFGIL